MSKYKVKRKPLDAPTTGIAGFAERLKKLAAPLKTPMGMGIALGALIVVVGLAYVLVTLSRPQAPAGDGALASIPPAQRNNYYQSAPPMTIDTTKTYTATIRTVKGDIVVALDVTDAPQTVNNFVFLSRQGFYDGLTFHRVETSSSFRLIQGGDPLGGGTGGPGYTIPAEIKAKHTAGAVAMARTGDDVNPQRASSGSQFYIGLIPLPSLDAGGYTVFGYVVAGLDVAENIQVGDVIQTILISEQ